jgi:hypothetical protein
MAAKARSVGVRRVMVGRSVGLDAWYLRGRPGFRGGLVVALDGAVGSLAVAGLHGGGAGAEVGLLLGHGALALAGDGRGEGGGGFGVEVGVAEAGEGAVGDDGAAGDLAGADEGAGAAGLDVGGDGAGGEELVGDLAGFLVVGLAAAEIVGVVGGLFAGCGVDHADLPEAFLEGRHVGEVGGLGCAEEQEEGGGEDGFLHGGALPVKAMGRSYAGVRCGRCDGL